MLSASEERELVAAAQSGDEAAREELIAAHVPLVRSMLARYRHPAVEQDDLAQEGLLALVEAVGEFDPDRGARFATFARLLVRRHVHRHFDAMKRPLSVTESGGVDLGRLRRAQVTLEDAGVTVDVDALAAQAGLTPERVVELLAVPEMADSLDARVGGGDDGQGLELAEVLADPAGDDVADVLAAELLPGEVRQLLADLLTGRERALLQLRHLDEGGPHSLRDVAGELGLSLGGVAALEGRALAKLLHPSARERMEVLR